MIAPFMLMLMADAGIATFTDGHELAAMCRADRPACTRYVVAASDMVASLENAKALPPSVCIGADADAKQLTDTVVRFLANHADALDQSAGALIWAALYDAHPCPSNGQ